MAHLRPDLPPEGGTPFSVTADPANPFKPAGNLQGPPPTVHQDPYVGRQEIYEGLVTLKLGFLIPPGTAPGTYVLKGTAGGQACDSKSCTNPDPTPWEIRVTVEAGAARADSAPPVPPPAPAAPTGRSSGSRPTI